MKGLFLWDQSSLLWAQYLPFKKLSSHSLRIIFKAAHFLDNRMNKFNTPVLQKQISKNILATDVIRTFRILMPKNNCRFSE